MELASKIEVYILIMMDWVFSKCYPVGYGDGASCSVGKENPLRTEETGARIQVCLVLTSRIIIAVYCGKFVVVTAI